MPVLPGKKIENIDQTVVANNVSMTLKDLRITIWFDIAADRAANSLTLMVPRLTASIPEVVTQERVDLANQRLADEGIEIKYIILDHGSNIEIVKRPEGKTDEDVYPLIWNALADEYEGSWVFIVPLQ